MKTQVEYRSGQSRHGDEGVDYMLAVVDGVELYAEAPVDPAEETGAYDYLREQIIAQAEEHGIGADRLAFMYDEEAQRCARPTTCSATGR